MDLQPKQKPIHPKSSVRAVVRKHWPYVTVVVMFAGTVLIALAAALRQTDGHLIYTLDDAFIHLAMAKNLAQHGVYGVTEYQFSASSSSPLWTLSLALAASIFGVHEVLPFLLNFLLGLAVLAVFYVLLRRSGVGPVTIIAVLLGITYATPLPAMVFSGMEHLLQILLTTLFLLRFAFMITAESDLPSGTEHIQMYALATSLVLVRFESYALIAIAGLFFLLRRRWKTSIFLFLAGIFPLACIQLISVAHGWSWLPNSVLIRIGSSNAGAGAGSTVTSMPGISRAFRPLSHFIGNVEVGLHVVALIVASGILLLVSVNSSSSLWTRQKMMVIVFILAGIAHLLFGNIGHFFRYEAYLIAIGLFTSACMIPEIAPMLTTGRTGISRATMSLVAVAIAFVLALIPLTVRVRDSLALIPVASRNIYQQQYQMGTFLHRYYPGAAVAVNDIGAVSFLTNARVFDLVGLASKDVLELKRAGEYNTERIQALCQERGVCIAIAYESWLKLITERGGPLPWTKVGEWRISGNVVCADDVVSFYAVLPSEKDRLIVNLRDFSSVLPASVTQSGLYTENVQSTAH